MQHDAMEGVIGDDGRGRSPSSSGCHAIRGFVESPEDLNDTGDVASQLPSDVHDDDDDWLDGREDGVLFTLIGDDDDVRQHPAAHRRGSDPQLAFDSISETSTVSLERQINDFHLTTERTLNGMLDTLRRRTMSPSAMDAAEEILRTSSPVEWNPYRPPRGVQYRARLEAQQVLEWKAYALAALHVQGSSIALPAAVDEWRVDGAGCGRARGGDLNVGQASPLGDSTDVPGFDAVRGSGVQWTPGVGGGPSTNDASAVAASHTNRPNAHQDGRDGATELMVCGHQVVPPNARAVAPGILCAHGGVLEEWVVRHPDDGTYDEAEVLAVGVGCDGEVDESRRLRSGLPPLSPRAAAEEERHDALVIQWWHSIAEPALEAAGLLRGYDDLKPRNAHDEDEDRGGRGNRCLVVDGGNNRYDAIDVKQLDSNGAMHPRAVAGEPSDTAGSNVEPDVGGAPTAPSAAHGTRMMTWLHQQRTPSKGKAHQQAFHRPSAPHRAGLSRDVTPERGELPSDQQEELVGPTERQSRRLKRSALPRGKPASSSPPPRRTHSLDKQPVETSSQPSFMVQGGRIGGVDTTTVTTAQHHATQHQHRCPAYRGDRVPSPSSAVVSDPASMSEQRPAPHQSSRYDGAVVVQHHVSRNRPETLRRLTKDQQQCALALLEEEASGRDGPTGHTNNRGSISLLLQQAHDAHGDHSRRRVETHAALLSVASAHAVEVQQPPSMRVVGRQCGVFADKDGDAVPAHGGAQRPPSGGGATELLPTSTCVRLPEIGANGGVGHRRPPMNQQSMKSLSRAQTAYVRPTGKKPVV